MKKLLIALDYDSFAQRIANIGHEWAKAMNAETILLHVIPESSYYSSLKYSPILGFESLSSLNVIESDNDAELVKMGQFFLEVTKQNLNDESVTNLVKVGDADKHILSIARDQKVDVIVMGSHHRKGIEKIFSGSVVEKILHQSTVPVLIVPIQSVE